jgi:N-acetyl-alpha-D-glucosaminyl L-malate synthase BshA
VTAVSGFLRDETNRVFSCGKEVEVIPNFVDARVFHPDAATVERTRFAPAGERLLVHASNFRKVKNLPAVLEVFAKVASRLPARLLLVGEGPELPAVRNRVEELGLAGAVDFLGHVDELQNVLPLADVLLLPSHHESFGLVALEAMACGVVPVVTSRGGAEDFVVDGVNGYLRDPEDVAGMVSAVLRLLEDEPHRQQLAEEARRDAAADFGAPCVVKQYLALYDRLLASGGAERRGS